MARAKPPRTVAEYKHWFASQGGKGRTRALTAKERSEAARKAVNARWRATSREQRREIARKAALTRWRKAAKKT